MALQLRRGTNAQRLAVTPLEGELIVVTDYEEADVSALWLGDGETAGGVNPISLELDELRDVVISTPAEGQQLFYDGTTWRNSNVITHTSATNRTVFRMDTSDAGINAVLNLRKNREGSAIANGDGAALKFQVSSNGTGTTAYALISASYHTTTPSINFGTSIDNEATDYVPQVSMGPFGLDVYQNEISLNKAQSGSPSLDAYITADRGSELSAKIRWNETLDKWQFTNNGSDYITLPSQNLETTSTPEFVGATLGYVLVGNASGSYNRIDTSIGDLILGAVTDVVQVQADLNVASGVLTVKDATNRVGVNNTSPSYDLDVTGQTRSTLGGLFRNVDVGVTEGNTVYATGNLNLNSSSGSVIVGNDLIVSGNLTVSGTSTTVNVSDMQIEDNIILLNRLESGSGVTLGTAGIEVERGSATNVQWVYDESNDWWAPGGDGASLNIWAAGNITAGTGLGTNSTVITFNNSNAGLPGNCDLKVQRGTLVDAAVIRWNESTDRWTFSNADSATFYNLPNQNLDTTSSVDFSNIVLDDRCGLDTTLTTTTSTTATAIATTARNVLKAVCYITDTVSGAVHCVEAMLLRNGSSAMLTTYGEMYSGSALATFTADISGGNMRLLATPASSNNTTFSVVRTSLT